MKRITAALLAVLALSAAGCQKKETTEESKAPDFTISMAEPSDTAPSETEETAAPTGEPTVPSDAVPSESAPTETTASAGETEPDESSAESGAQTPGTFVPGETDDGLLGTWEYEDGFRMEFCENNAVMLYINYNSAMGFSDGYFYVGGEMDCPVVADEKGVTATYEDEIILYMTPVEGTNSASLRGLYHLEDCYVRDNIATGEAQEFYVLLDDNIMYLGSEGAYNAADGKLELFNGGDILHLDYVLYDGALSVTDENDMTDVLVKVD